MSVYHDAGGFDVLLGLCRRWHELCLSDPVANHPFSRQLHPHHDERLAAYLSEALGGPMLYTAGYGDESSMRRLHAGNGTSKELNDACLRLFDQALTEMGIEGETWHRISTYFRRTATSFDAYADSKDLVPDDLPLKHA